MTGRRGVLARAFDILGCFAGGAERSVADVCHATDLPPATVHRMLATLAEHGAIERTSWGRYRLGPSLWRLGHDVHEIRRLRDCARPALIDLHATTRLPVALATREGDRLQVMDKIAGRKVAGWAWTALGTPLLTQHPGGLVLLAWGATPQHPGTQAPPAGRDEFAWRQELAEIRRQGFCHSRPADVAANPAIWAAAPVFSIDKSVTTCVIIGGVHGEHPPAALGRLARTTATEISAGLRRGVTSPSQGAEA
ncbi:IclR family transcriptional regulator [Aeromicrobium wangtongii]|uniref:Helix-turn-helix domain-containing protein n=1 Tax=Aeromicrobium wangtongii TaxID=2969247 RepID=A0ABY5M929_9ACTN|nr:helix-turn-helix domain-containing protein [Aeromicrobium wangtongii]MCD9199834.1 helix-turn-helix domain-containing protein [Aeromicrobium wangtongii]UUP13454.1 helix-turn-helix domain-containing protein [Aeromicrobium wangtongii]